MKHVHTIIMSLAASSVLLQAGGAVAPVPAEPEPVKEASAWHYEAQLYMLGLWIDGPMETGYRYRLLGQEKEGSSRMDLAMTPKDIIDNLKMGFMGHFEAHHQNHWGIWLDYAFMNLGKSDALPHDKLTSMQMGYYQGVFEGFVTYRAYLEEGHIDYYGGIRWWHNELTFSLDENIKIFQLVDIDRTIDWYDPVIGARWSYPINEKWTFQLRGDVGGFGITDSTSDWTAAVELGALYDIDDTWQVKMSFKSLWVDFEEGSVGQADRFVYDTVSYGPILGIAYRF